MIPVLVLHVQVSTPLVKGLCDLSLLSYSDHTYVAQIMLHITCWSIVDQQASEYQYLEELWPIMTFVYFVP